MKRSCSLIIAAVALCFAQLAAAQTTIPRNAARISWTNATQNTDDTAVPASCPSGQTLCGKLVNTRVEYGSCNAGAFGTKQGEIVTAWPGAEVMVSNLVVQTYCFRAFHKNDYNVESMVSNITTKTIAPPQPKPPLIAVDTVAYEIKEDSTGELVATRIGLVPMGAYCLSERQQVVKGVTYYLVDRRLVDIVNWPANPKLTDVYVRCS